MLKIKNSLILFFVLSVALCLGSSCLNIAHSQLKPKQSAIHFLDNVEWNEVQKMADKTGKQIYVYCYTTW